MQIHNLCTEERTKIILQRAQCLPVLPILRKETSAFLKPQLPEVGAAPACPRQTPGLLHVDAVCVLLAQGLVLLGVERLPLQVHMADLGQKAEA